jgi:hypothetical protein
MNAFLHSKAVRVWGTWWLSTMFWVVLSIMFHLIAASFSSAVQQPTDFEQFCLVLFALGCVFSLVFLGHAVCPSEEKLDWNFFRLCFGTWIIYAVRVGVRKWVLNILLEVLFNIYVSHLTSNRYVRVAVCLMSLGMTVPVYHPWVGSMLHKVFYHWICRSDGNKKTVVVKVAYGYVYLKTLDPDQKKGSTTQESVGAFLQSFISPLQGFQRSCAALKTLTTRRKPLSMK